MKAWVVQFTNGVRLYLHRRADRIRVETYGHQVEMQQQRLPARYIKERAAFPLAWADFLDALGDV